MILIADSGSTKASWCLLNGRERRHFNTEGYNPYFVTAPYIVSSLQSRLPDGLETGAVKAVHFFGAGCTPKGAGVVTEALGGLFRNASIHVDTDQMASAIALLGDQPGFAAILGTGANTCIYDGRAIQQHIPSLGHMLGDEGSGGNIGKRLLTAFLRDRLPEELAGKFTHAFRAGKDSILHTIYREPQPNRFCASFCRFVADHIDHPFMEDMVRSAFNDFFRELVCLYPDYRKYSFNCTGSIAFHFRHILFPVAALYGMEPGRVIANPITGLAERFTAPTAFN